MSGILYHGSSIYTNILIPKTAYDWGYEEGCMNAVYATSNKNQALSFALGSVPDSNGEVERLMDIAYGDKMIFWKGRPNLDGIGYLYILEGKDFIYTRGTQWVCKNNVIPLEIIK